MEIEKAKALTLPDGSCLKIECTGSEKGLHQTLDISIVTPKGHESIICAVDNTEKGLKVLVYNEDDEDPVFIQNYGIRWGDKQDEQKV